MTNREKVLIATNLVLLVLLAMSIGNRLPEKVMAVIAWGILIAGLFIPTSLLVMGYLQSRNPPPLVVVAPQWTPGDFGAESTYPPLFHGSALLEAAGELPEGT